MFNPWHWYLREIWDSPAAGSICYNYKTRRHYYCPVGPWHYAFAGALTFLAALLVLALVLAVLTLLGR